MASRRSQLVKDYPNFFSRNLMVGIGCVNEFTEEEAKEFFMRICFHSLRIVQVEPTKNNHQPTCVWRVYYKLINPNSELSDDKSIAQPVPDDEESLKTLFINITAHCEYGGLKVVQKQIYVSQDKSYAVVEYSPKSCSCTCQDFKLVAEVPRMRPAVLSEVEIEFSSIKL